MDGGVIALTVIVILVLVALGLLVGRRPRSQQHQERFGPEYERTVTETGDRRAAESDLLDRQARREHLHIVPLEPAARAVSSANERGEASTEDLRQALVHYRSLFEELLDVGRADETDQAIEEAGRGGADEADHP